jgi:hypothetical protein
MNATATQSVKLKSWRPEGLRYIVLKLSSFLLSIL